MTCKLCQEQIKDWEGSDPVCAFKSGSFSHVNYRCATVRQIRKLADRLGLGPIPGVQFFTDNTEQRYATISIANVKEFWHVDLGGFENTHEAPVSLYVGWYKNRGATECMWLMFEYGNQPPRPPTEAECLAIINAYSSYIDKEKFK